MPPEGAASERRVQWLDSLRALAAIWVVAHHAASPTAFASWGFLGRQLGHFLAHGTLAVTAFIALSGYSLGLGALRRDWRLRAGYGEFLRARAIRILPPYWIAIALTLAITLLVRAALEQSLDGVQVRAVGLAFAKHLFLLQDLDGTDLISLPGWGNGVFWTIGVEFKIYFLFPFMLWAIRRGGLLLGAASATLFAVVFAALPGLKVERKPGFIVVFFLGVAACTLASRLPRWGAVGAALVFLFIGLACIQTDPEAHQLPRDLLFGAGFCGLMAAIESLPRFHSLLEHRWLTTTGESAYSLYLVHALVILLLAKATGWARFGNTPLSVLSFLAVALTASLLAARGFFVVAERPFFRIRHKTPIA